MIGLFFGDTDFPKLILKKLKKTKKRYLRLIPYTWKLINTRIYGNVLFDDLKKLLNKNFKKELNEN